MLSVEFKPGDVVKLKSQPETKMTVEHAYPPAAEVERTVFCVWLDKEGRLQRDRLDPSVLVHDGPLRTPVNPRP